MDSNTGSTYYVDEATGESQWEEPPPEEDRLGTVAVSKNSNQPTPLSKSQRNHFEEKSKSLITVVPAILRAKRKWRAFVDNGTGSTYYVNEETGAVQWEKPAEIDGDGREGDKNTAVIQVQEEPADEVDERTSTGGRDDSDKEKRVAPDNGGTTNISSVEAANLEVEITVVKPPVAASKVSADEENYGDGDGSGAVDSEPPLTRADSSSTLSTYGGDLDSLAKYVTGHSTTLDRGAVVELEVEKTRREGEGDSTTDTDEGTLQSTVEEPSDNSSRSTSESGIEGNEQVPQEPVSTRQSSAVPSSEPSTGADTDTSSQNDTSSANEHSSTATQKVSKMQADEAFDGGNQALQSLSSSAVRDMDGREVLSGRQPFDPNETRGEGGTNSPVLPIIPGETEKDEGVAFSAEEFNEAADSQQKSSTASPHSPISEVEGAVPHASKDAPADNSSTESDMTHSQGSADAASEDNNSAAEPVTQTNASVDEKPLHHAATAATIATKRPSGFDTAAVAAVALNRLKAGMQLRRQNDAVVKLQAQARGWAARRLHAELSRRRETRRREEREVKQRAAAAIQAVARGRAGRRKAHQARLMRGSLEGQHPRNEATETSSIRERARSGITSAREGDQNLGGGLDTPMDGQNLRFEHTEPPHNIPASQTSESQDKTVQEQRPDIRRDNDGAIREDGGHPAGRQQPRDSADTAADGWSEEEYTPSSDDAGHSVSGEHEQLFGQEQVSYSLGFDEYGGAGGRFEAGPLGTIDEEGYQRNGHLWGGVEEADRSEPNASASSEDNDEEALDQNNKGGACGPSGWSGQGEDTAVGGPSGSSDSLSNSDEESTDEGEEDAIDSDERKYDSTSRTTLSSGSLAPGWERGASGLVVSERESGSGSLPEDETSESSSHQSSDNSVRREDGVLQRRRQQQQQQQQEEEEEEEEEEDRMTHSQAPNEKAKFGSPGMDRVVGAIDLSLVSNTSQIGGDDETVSDHAEYGGFSAFAAEQVVGKGVYLDSNAPLDRLEDLRSLVAEQAQAAARVTMTAAGTDASKREATRIRYCVRTLTRQI